VEQKDNAMENFLWGLISGIGLSFGTLVFWLYYILRLDIPKKK
jgi:hypothetical protein